MSGPRLNMLHRIKNLLLTIAFPQPCRVCGSIVDAFDDGFACDKCWKSAQLYRGNETLCAKCSEFLKPGASDHTAFCHLCDDHAYDAARAVGRYEGSLAASIIALKSEPYIPKRLIGLIGEAFFLSPFVNADLIVPVPLSRKRLGERGFNQAEVIGRALADRTGLEIDAGSLVRRRHTPTHRAAMDRRARELTVENAFETVRPRLIKDRSVVLVDDVMTSGATAAKCAQTLKKSGAREVFVLTVARASNTQF